MAKKYIGCLALLFLATALTFLLSACLAVKTPGPTATATVSPTASPTFPPSQTPPPTPTPPATPTSAPQTILDEVRLRQGIAYCTDKEALVQAAYPWLDQPGQLEMDALLPRAHWAYPPEGTGLIRYPFDPGKGKALFEQAGWILAPDATYRTNAAGQELTLSLTTTDSGFRQAWAAVFEEQMKACGLRLQRIHLPAAQFYGDLGQGGELGRRVFELAAYARLVQAVPQWLDLYACERIPSAENGWKGKNFAGWCNPKAYAALRLAASSPQRAMKREAYRIVQVEYSQDLPGLPLFSRIEAFAAHPALQNFSPDSSEYIFTWNAAQWIIPGKDTIIIGERSEPAGLLPWDVSAVNTLIGALLNSLDYTARNYDYQSVLLRQIPSLDNGGVSLNVVQVGAGESVADMDGNVVELKPGVRLFDADEEEIVYEGGLVRLNQLTTRFDYTDGLTWSDGKPVTRDDYELGYKIYCSPDTYGEQGYSPGETLPPVCDQIASVKFLGDQSYEVTWKPGFQQGCYGSCLYFLPPFSRLPAHFKLSDGRQLMEVPPREWASLDEVYSGLPGVGPYVVSKWKYGEEMILTANPYYYLGKPATATIIIRFIPQGETAASLVKGEVDVLGDDSLLPEQVPGLLQAQGAGQVRLYLLPAPYFEQIDFALQR